MENKAILFLPKSLLVIVFITIIESKLRQGLINGYRHTFVD